MRGAVPPLPHGVQKQILSHVLLKFPGVSFPSGASTKILYVFFTSCARCLMFLLSRKCCVQKTELWAEAKVMS